jgi:hypothetical protein
VAENQLAKKRCMAQRGGAWDRNSQTDTLVSNLQTAAGRNREPGVIKALRVRSLLSKAHKNTAD